MTVVTDAGLQAADPTVFTENVLEIAVPEGNPGDVTGLADFGNADLTLAICARRRALRRGRGRRLRRRRDHRACPTPRRRTSRRR